jgi:hypothetical protein
MNQNKNLKEKPDSSHRPLAFSISAIIFLILLALIQLQLIFAERENLSKLSSKVERLLNSQVKDENKTFPSTEAMIEAFEVNSLEIATRLAENLVFAYPADFTSYERLVFSYTKVLQRNLSNNQLLEASQLVNWMSGIQERQIMVLRGPQYINLYLETLDLNRSLRNEVLEKAEDEMKRLRATLANLDGQGNSDIPALIREATNILLVANFLGDEELGVQGTDYVESLRLISRHEPNMENTPAQMISYLRDIISLINWGETILPEAEFVLRERINLVSLSLSEILENSVINRQIPKFSLGEYDSLKFLVESNLVPVELSLAWRNLLEASQAEVEREINILLTSFFNSDISSFEFDKRVKPLAAKLEYLDETGSIIIRLKQSRINLEEEKGRKIFDHKISLIYDLLKLKLAPEFDLENILTQVALLGEPRSPEQYAAIMKLSVEIQNLQRARDQQNLENLSQKYNLWAYRNLRESQAFLNDASRNNRATYRIDVARVLASINPALLNRAMQEYYNVVFNESMKGLSENERLKSYERWVNTTPFSLETIKNVNLD